MHARREARSSSLYDLAERKGGATVYSSVFQVSGHVVGLTDLMEEPSPLLGGMKASPRETPPTPGSCVLSASAVYRVPWSTSSRGGNSRYPVPPFGRQANLQVVSLSGLRVEPEQVQVSLRPRLSSEDPSGWGSLRDRALPDIGHESDGAPPPSLMDLWW